MKSSFLFSIVAAVFMLVVLTSGDSYAENRNKPRNPCSPEIMNPCNPEMMNPCSPKMTNPCSPEIMNPCSPEMMNPCGGKPHKPIRSKHEGDINKLVNIGKKMWNDDNLGNAGMSCMNCHDDYENLSGKEWPHYVEMTKDVVTLDQMINFCMINPMEGKQLDPNSIEMTAMSAYYKAYMKNFKGGKKKKMKNPCNPCGR